MKLLKSLLAFIVGGTLFYFTREYTISWVIALATLFFTGKFLAED